MKFFSRKARKSFSWFLNPKLVIGLILENGFEATLRLKTKFWGLKIAFFIFLQVFEWRSWKLVKSLWKKHFKKWFWAALMWKMKGSNMKFFTFFQILSDEVETVSWEKEANLSKLSKSKIGHRKQFSKWFWSHFKLKREC